jgi:pSer/pThr/pTyr-binding forkhead associated (FHA) protein
VDAIDVVILALRLVFVALLYAFLIFVIRMAMGATRPSAVQRLKLRVLEPGATNLAVDEVLVVARGATLGRSDRADVVLPDTAISGEHARLERLGRRWVVTDLGSPNGTRVNDSVVRGRAPLDDGDVLTLGTVRLEVVGR